MQMCLNLPKPLKAHLHDTTKTCDNAMCDKIVLCKWAYLCNMFLLHCVNVPLHFLHAMYLSLQEVKELKTNCEVIILAVTRKCYSAEYYTALKYISPTADSFTPYFCSDHGLYIGVGTATGAVSVYIAWSLTVFVIALNGVA